MKDQLVALYNGEKTVDEVYDSIVPSFNTRSLKRARYAKMRIHLPEESRRLNLFLRALFGMPIPLFIARFIMRKTLKSKIQSHVDDHLGFSYHDLDQLLKYSRGTTVSIDTDEAQIRIKIR